jgi:hypothetical protein
MFGTRTSLLAFSRTLTNDQNPLQIEQVVRHRPFCCNNYFFDSVKVSACDTTPASTIIPSRNKRSTGDIGVNGKLNELYDNLISINRLLNWPFLSQTAKTQLEQLKAEVEAELHICLAQGASAPNET